MKGMQHAWGKEMCIALFQKPEWKDHLEDPGIDVWITLKLISKKQGGRHGLAW
jgi:hypothetical protein